MKQAILVAALAGCGPGFQMPEPDSCADPTAPRGPLVVEIGGPTGGAWEEGAVVTPVVGGQGSDMLVIRTFLSGGEVPSCVTQVVEVRVPSTTDTLRDVHDLPFKPSGGKYVGGPIYVVPFGLRAGVEVTIDVTVGGSSLTRKVLIE